MPLSSQRYGKERVRVMRVVRGAGDVHTVHEVEVGVSLEGEAFAETFNTGDNAQVVPTDTMKNTVHVLAQDHLGASPERFALALADHFLGRHAQIERVRIEVVVRPWDRYAPADGGEPHAHTFVGRITGTPFSRVESGRGADGTRVQSGWRDVLLLKSTASSFKGYPRCDLTTLPETDDRILATKMAATWTFSGRDADFEAVNSVIPAVLIDTFAREFSPSVQRTLLQMGEAALAAAPGIVDIQLAMPNKHYLPINFQPFGRENANEIFLPTDEPHGQIEARVVRAAAPVPA